MHFLKWTLVYTKVQTKFSKKTNFPLEFDTHILCAWCTRCLYIVAKYEHETPPGSCSLRKSRSEFSAQNLWKCFILKNTCLYIGCLQPDGSIITRKSTWNFKIWVRFVKYRSSLSREWNLHEYGPVVVKLEHFEVGTPKTLTPSTLRKKFPSSLGSDGLGIAPIHSG